MFELASVLLLGIGAQWLAWRLRLPSILLLLLIGFAVGPFTRQHFLDPDALLGGSLLPLVALSVALILLEGGLSLRLRDIRGVGRAVRNLILIGTPVTFLLASLAARWTLGFDWGLAFLIGAILVVTGPTVIIPLLRHVRPSGAVGSVVRWEGIVGDPIGAILAVVVFQALLISNAEDAAAAMGFELLRAAVVGGLLGAAGAGLLVFLLKQHLVPDFLHNSVALAIGLSAFLASNAVSHESGLLAVTLMGVLLANQNAVVVEHIVEFKENLRVLLISSLFILLAARLPLEEFSRFDSRSFFFVFVLIVVVRPIAVFLALIRSGLSWAERAFVAWMAPRGIVAAAVSSVFGLELAEIGYPDADRLVSVVFAVIVITVSVYGLTAGHLARWLGLSGGQPQGILIVGAHSWARALAERLQAEGIRVALVDTNYGEVGLARMAGLDAHHGSVLSEDLEERIAFDDMGHVLCLTHNDEVNSLTCLHLAPSFGRSGVYQLADSEAAEHGAERLPAKLRGRVLFAAGLDYWDIQARMRDGAIVKATRLGEEYSYADFVAAYERPEAPVVPLFVMDVAGRVVVVTADKRPEPGAGSLVIALVDPLAQEAVTETA